MVHTSAWIGSKSRLASAIGCCWNVSDGSQQRRFERVQTTSGLPQTRDIDSCRSERSKSAHCAHDVTLHNSDYWMS
jgi:hypothetical protein